MSLPSTNPSGRKQRGGEAPARSRGRLARTLLFFLLPFILAPLATFALIIYRQVQTNLTAQVSAQLSSLASLKESQIDQWATSRVADIATLARSPDVVALAQAFAADGAGQEAVRGRLQRFLIGNGAWEAVMLAAADTGQVQVSTLQFRMDRFEGDQFLDAAQLAQAQRTAYLLPPGFDDRMRDVRILVTAPVVDETGRTLALLFGFAYDEPLLNMVAASPGLGSSGHAYVVTHDGYQLSSFVTAPGASADTEGIVRARMDHANGTGIYANQKGETVIGAYRWLPFYQLAILVEVHASEAFAPLRQFAGVLAAVGLASLVVSAVGVLFLTRRLLTDPLKALTESATRLAGGDLNAMVKVGRSDEIGLLAETFNSMATELRGLYQDLESRVEARTQQLEAAAEVGRAATSILSSDELLSRTVDLIRDRFGYYHVSIFMLDDSGRWAILQEATGEAGAQLKARGHRLAVGSNSLIGWVTANRKPRIALDVASDEVHFRNELLPDTRSEAALPLRVGERLIGALDVQSRSLNAFNQSDIDVLQVLADQIAVAVENGRLFARQERAAQLDQRVASLTARIHRSLTLDGILESAAAELGEAFGARKVVVRLSPEAQPAPAYASAANGEHSNGHAADSAPGSPIEA